MIISKTPLRISFVGGGTDFSDFYKIDGGAVVSTTIDKYIYIMVNDSLDGKFHFNNEHVNKIDEFQHTLVRETLSMLELRTPVTITSASDIPAGTGLGSSSAFTVGLLNAIYKRIGHRTNPKELAEQACEIEINRLNHPIGKQDQYAAAYGGLNGFSFWRDGEVMVTPMKINEELQNKLLLFYTGITRHANDILKEQKSKTSENYLKLNEIYYEALHVMNNPENPDINGKMLDRTWRLKKNLASGINNKTIETAYSKAIESGAEGGKLLGAGGGGFLLIYADEENQKNIINNIGLNQVKFRMTNEGSHILRS